MSKKRGGTVLTIRSVWTFHSHGPGGPQDEPGWRQGYRIGAFTFFSLAIAAYVFAVDVELAVFLLLLAIFVAILDVSSRISLH